MSRLGSMELKESEIAVAQIAEAKRPVGSARLAAGVLAFCCICWGFSFPVMQFASASLDGAVRPAMGGRVSTGLEFAVQGVFNSWRFAVAAAVYWVLTWRWQRGYTAADWKAGVTVGLFCGGGMFLQLTGLRYTLPSVSAFLTALAVVFAPLAQSLLFGKTVGARTWGAVVIAIGGMLLLSQSNPGAVAESTKAMMPPLPYLGEILTIVSSVLFTGHIMAVGHYGAVVAPARMTAVMLAVVAVVNGAGGLALGGWEIYTGEILGALVRDPVFIGAILGLVLLSSVVAMHLMNRYQPLVAAATASVIYCLEPVFATLWSMGFRTEQLTPITATGGGVILVASLMAVLAATREGK